MPPDDHGPAATPTPTPAPFFTHNTAPFVDLAEWTGRTVTVDAYQVLAARDGDPAAAGEARFTAVTVNASPPPVLFVTQTRPEVVALLLAARGIRHG
jgi:hypothetical protein